MTHYVYRHFKEGTNEVFYIGRSKVEGYERAYVKAPSARTKEWNDFYRKYGRDVEIVADGLCEEFAAELEEFMVYLYGRIDIGTGCLVNKANGGLTSKGMVRSSGHKMRLSKARKGMYIGELNPYYGKIHSEDIRNKMKKPHLSVRGSGAF